MAKGDLLDVKYSGVYNTTTSIVFASAPTEGDLLIFAVIMRNNQTVTTEPTGATLERSLQGYPGIYLYSKIAGASESDTHSVTTSATESFGLLAFRYEGVFSGSEFSVSTINNAGSGTTLDIPASPLSSSVNGKSLAIFSTYVGSSLDHALDNSFVLDTTITNPNYIVSTSGAFGYGIKTITHPDTDIQSTLTYGTSTGSAGLMVLLQPTAAGGTTEQVPSGAISLTQGTPKKVMRLVEKVPAHGT